MPDNPVISAEQLHEFEQEGYLLVKGLLDPVEVLDPAQWERMWRETRDHLAQIDTTPFNRWAAGHPACA